MIGGIIMRSDVSTLSKWGNSSAVRIPASVLRGAGFQIGDRVRLEISEGENILIKKADSPKPGTLEYLFKDYSGESFDTELIDIGDAAGEEKW
jgi:antitoxin component of MazEF toxin-antitoxin module